MESQNIVDTLVGYAVTFGVRILTGIVILVLGRIAAGVVKSVVGRALGRANADPSLTTFVQNLAFFAVLAFAIVATLARVGIQTASFVAVLGAAGLAIGLALQGSLSNFASGVMILLFRPFRVGDVVDTGVLGTVKEIQLFSTILATPDNVKVIVPNSTIYSGTIKNFTAFDTRRFDVVVGIGYDMSIQKACEAALRAAKADARVLTDPAPEVFVTELADSSVNLTVRCWVSRTVFWATKCDVTKKVKEAFDGENIEIPFPQRVVHMVGK